MSQLRELIREHLLMEEVIANLKSNITIDFQISKHDTGVHFNKRQGRHDEYIYREKIEGLIEDAIDEIATQIVQHNIRHMRRFVISREGGDYLNVVIEPSIINGNSWNLAVVTIMMKPNFDVKPGQLRFFVSANEDEDYD
jgi:hypothetical protein